MKFIFLDRDGVINRDPQEKLYVTDWNDFHFIPGSKEALVKLTRKGYKIAVISNQAGVSKGIYTLKQLDEITGRMLKELKDAGADIYSVQYCIHMDADNCDCRKPKTGLFKKATEGLRVDFSRTYFIGDTRSDMEAGKMAGCRTILVLSGKTRDRAETEAWPVKPDIIKRDLKEAMEEVE